MSVNPWMKFYPTDWRGDAALRSVSFAARGLWMDMLSLMHEADPYGHLLVNGRAPPADRLARMLGGALEEVTQLLDELEEQGVFSRTGDGIIYSRRMVRDYAKAARDKANGSAGGNPNIKRNGPVGVNPPLNPQVNPGDNGGDKAHIPEARIQKLESEKEERTPYTPPRVPLPQQKRPPAAAGCVSDPPGFAEFWAKYPKREAKGAAIKAYARALTLTDADTLLDALDRNWPSRKYTPLPATWLNNQRWLDEIETGDPVLAAVMAANRSPTFPEPVAPTSPLRLVQ
jgi:hypothetical protein